MKNKAIMIVKKGMLGWFDHVERMDGERSVRKINDTQVNGKDFGDAPQRHGTIKRTNYFSRVIPREE